ncbi:hypothetical protein BB559_005787 [Furculomyces boomerangus]|uniref:Ribophorin II n=2 Tax=Harpellales TaxID=61421 RepID=A0A2T9Y6K5_9FUNG|nr:hypothetical protein BB559_005787 [Furculomyces boomerangus]PVZ99449.1 hypothetical protein BB558_004539 [Smittium angustum]
MLSIKLFIITFFLVISSQIYSEIILENVSLDIIDSASEIIAKERIKYPQKISKINKIDVTEKLSISFQAKSSLPENNDTFNLNQASVVFTSKNNQEQFSFSTKYTPYKKVYKVTLGKDKLKEKGISNSVYKMDLVLGSYDEPKGLVYAIGEIELKVGTAVPGDKHEELGPKPEILHTFSKPEKMVSAYISISFSAFLVVAFIGFLVVLKSFGLDFSLLSKSSASDYIFYLCILSYAGVIFSYWVGIKLFPTLFNMLLLAVPTLVFGNISLKAKN